MTQSIVLDFLELFCESEFEIVGIIESAPKRFEKKLLKRIFYQLSSHRDDLRNFAEKHFIDYFFYSPKKDLYGFLKNKNPDILISFAVSQILKENVLQIPKYACINIHPSFLPDLRGPDPLNWAIIRGDKKIGLTLHVMDAAIDAGAIISQTQVGIDNVSSFEELINKLCDTANSLLCDVLKNIEKVKFTPQKLLNEHQYANVLSPAECKKLLKITEKSVQEVFRMLSLLEDGYSFLIENKLFNKFFWLQPIAIKQVDSAHSPGSVFYKKRNVFLKCTNGCIQLKLKIKRFEHLLYS